MTWWLWIVLGFVLLLGEILAPGGMFLLFFGVGGILTGALAWTGAVEPESVQWALFGIISVVLLVLFRGRLKAGLCGTAPSKDVDGLVGQSARATSAIGINEVGQVELRGASWSAKNIGSKPLVLNDRCVVQSVDGLMLLVKGE